MKISYTKITFKLNINYANMQNKLLLTNYLIWKSCYVIKWL